MELNTSSAAISFAKQLEDESSTAFSKCAEMFPSWADTLGIFIRENKRHTSEVDRAYFSVVSDALDTGFSFTGIDSDDYKIESILDSGAQSDSLRILINNEERVIAYYSAAAQASRALLTDVARSFDRVTKRHRSRLGALGGLPIG